MKLKKIVAAAAAAVMALAMLTACSGGGGGIVNGGSYTIKMTLVEQDGEEITETRSEYATSNGEWTYSEMVRGAKRRAYLNNEKTDDEYVLNIDTKKAFKIPKQDDTVTPPDSSDEKEIVTKKTGEWKYKNVTYTTQEMIYTVPGEDGYQYTVKLCYKSGKLEYYVTESKDVDGTYYTIARVDQYSNTADETKLKISDYELVDTYDDLGLHESKD